MMVIPRLRTCDLCGESEVNVTIIDYVVSYNAMNLTGCHSAGHLVTVTQCEKCWDEFSKDLAERVTGGARVENLPVAYAESQEPPEPDSLEQPSLLEDVPSNTTDHTPCKTDRPPFQLTGRIGSFCVGCIRAIDGKCSEFASGLPMKADGSEGTCCYRELPGVRRGKE